MTFRMTTSGQIQVWALMFEISPFEEAFSRDLQRAKREWRDEDRIWLIPGAERVARWPVGEGGRFSECLIPSETMNLISVIHVDEGRRTYPPIGLPEDWPNLLPEGLYWQWLNATPLITEGPKSLRLRIPVARGERVSYVEETFYMEAGPIMPIAGVDEQARLTLLAWPQAGAEAVAPVSPETESRQFFGPLRRERVRADGQDIEVVVPEQDSQFRALNVWLRWPEPFGALFPTGGGADLLYHRGLMRSYLDELRDGRYEKILRETEGWVSLFTGEAQAPLGKAWFMPKVLANPDEVLLVAEVRYDIAADSLEELVRSKRFQEVERTPIMVRQVRGWLGYFWWEFYCDLSRHVTIRLCQNCGGVIRGGHADRQCCTRLENLECHRQRNAEAQRRGRRRRK